MKLRLFAAILACATPAARAQDAPVKLWYRFGADRQIDTVLHAVVGQPGLVLAAKPGPDTLAVAIAGEIERDGGDKPKGFRFMLAFTRDGDRLGESWEDCNIDRMDDCTHQISDDIRSADAIHR
jgi:hypothetical protein